MSDRTGPLQGISGLFQNDIQVSFLYKSEFESMFGIGKSSYFVIPVKNGNIQMINEQCSDWKDKVKTVTSDSQRKDLDKELINIDIKETEEFYDEYSNKIITPQGYINKTIDAYYDYITTANKIRDIFEIDSYLDYVYVDTYNRDYSVEDALKFCDYTKKNLASIYARNRSIKKPTGLNKDFINAGLQSFHRR